jgi:serine/threonine protein kinase
MKKVIYYIVSFLSLGLSFSAFAAEVDVEKYHRANPDLLDIISNNTVLEFNKTIGETIGTGTNGSISPVVTAGFEEFVIKLPNVKNEDYWDVIVMQQLQHEIAMGQYIRYKRRNITSKTQIADIQGLCLVVPGKGINYNGIDGNYEALVQERIHGVTLKKFTFKNGWIDTPKKACERLLVFLNSLHALEKAGIAHNDLHPGNIMMERKRLPDEVIAANVEAKARQMAGITEEEDLTEEDQYEYIPRIIDFGRAEKIGTRSLNDINDMQDLKKLMPIFLFGRKKKDDTERNQPFVKKLHKMNDAMQAEIGKSYPEPVLNELARIATDCLSRDATQCPTAAEVFEEVTDLTLSDWDSGHYTILPGNKRNFPRNKRNLTRKKRNFPGNKRHLTRKKRNFSWDTANSHPRVAPELPQKRKLILNFN